MSRPYIFVLTKKAVRYVDENGRLRAKPRSAGPADPSRQNPSQRPENRPPRRRRRGGLDLAAEAEVLRREGEQS
jgi:hypothetical protein